VKGEKEKEQFLECSSLRLWLTMTKNPAYLLTQENTPIGALTNAGQKVNIPAPHS
jgi:hypothetical protein